MSKRIPEIPESIGNPNFPSTRPRRNIPPAASPSFLLRRTRSIPFPILQSRLPPKTPPRNPKDFQKSKPEPRYPKREAEAPIGFPRRIRLRSNFRTRLRHRRFFRPRAPSPPFRLRGLRPISSRCPTPISMDVSTPLRSGIRRTFPVPRVPKISPFIRRAADCIWKKFRPSPDIFPRRESPETSSF